MKYFKINDIKWATLLLLKRIDDMYSLEFPKDNRLYNEKEWESHSHSINPFLSMDGISYVIQQEIFASALLGIEAGNMVRVVNHMPLSIIEIIGDPLIYANEEMQRN